VTRVDEGLPLPMTGSLPPELQGTLFRVGPARPWVAGGDGGAAGGDATEGDQEGAGPPETVDGSRREGALHAVELRDGRAVSSIRRDSEADAGVFWHAGSVLALPEAGMPSRYSRFLEPEEFTGGLTVPIASHVHRQASDGGRVLFGVEGGDPGADDGEGTFLRIGEWDASGALRTAQSVELQRATWQHDIGVTAGHVVFIESPTTRLLGEQGGASAVPFGWMPGAQGWMGVVPRGGDGSAVRWFRLDPCLVTHVLGAYDEAPTDAGRSNGKATGTLVLYVCRYEVPEPGQPVDLSASVVGPAGIGLTGIGGNLAVLERWRIAGERVERKQVDERTVEYPRMDAACEGGPFRYGYSLETGWVPGQGEEVSPFGLLKFDLERDEASSWSPGPGCTPSEPIFVRALDGHGDDEGWLLTVVDDANRGASDLYVLDASSFGRSRPEAVIHLPRRLPVRSHGEWVPADRYR
jgi:carotenoid cleavage dioxygenase-like enzyme